MKTIKILRNSAGIGLVEVMMAIAITGGLTLTIAKLMENAGQSAKQIEAKSENISLKGIIQDVLNNPTACSNTFGTVMSSSNVTALSASTSATVSVPNIKDKLNVIKYSSASTNISPLSITSMEITNYNALAYTGDLVVNSTFRKSSSMVMMVKPIRIPINFSFTAGSLTACSTMAVGGEWLLGGNAGTVDGTDYIGTSDATAFNIKVNAQKAGRIEHVWGQTFFGYQAGMSQISNDDGTAFGYQASKYNTSGTNNSSFGWVALRQNTTGSENSAFGNRSLEANTIGGNNAAFGGSTLTYNTTGTGNSAFGWGSLYTNVSTNYNTAIGFSALFSTSTSGSNNTAIGAYTLNQNTSGRGNFAGGTYSLSSNNIGSWNTATGLNSLQYNTTGEYNSAVGAEALRNNNGSFNTASGFGAMAYNTSGSLNTAIGKGALSYSTSGSSNTALGLQALYATSGSYNTALGQDSLDSITGNNNSALGYNAGGATITGSNNLYLGANSGTGASTSSSKLYIETSGATNPLIGGDFSSSGRYVTVSSKMGIGLTIGDVPLSRLVVNGPSSPNYAGAANQLGTFYSDTPADGMYGVYTHVNPGTWTSWTQAGFFDSSTSAGVIGGKSVGVKGRSYANAVGSSGRTFGVWGMAGNATPGWNYGVYGEVLGSNAGAGIFGTATQYEDGLDTTAYRSGKLAAFFHGDTFTAGQIYSTYATVLTSDRRLKKNIKPLENSLEKILKLEGVNFDWKQNTKMTFEKRQQIGLIAQNVEEQFPLAVTTTTNSAGELKFVSYSALIAPLIESVKSLYAKILALITSDEKQNLEIKELKLENEKLKMEMKKQQESFDLRMKKLEAQSAKK